MPSPGRNPFFSLTALCSGAFIVTVLAMIAGLYGDSRAPIADWLDEFGGWALAVEVLGILVCGFLALAVDRRQTLAESARSSESKREQDRQRL